MFHDHIIHNLLKTWNSNPGSILIMVMLNKMTCSDCINLYSTGCVCIRFYLKILHHCIKMLQSFAWHNSVLNERHTIEIIFASLRTMTMDFWGDIDLTIAYIFVCTFLENRVSQGPLLLTWLNFDPSNQRSNRQSMWNEITYPFPNFNGATVDVS